MYLLHETRQGGSELLTVTPAEESDDGTLKYLPQMASRPITLASLDLSSCERFLFTDAGGRVILVEAKADFAHWKNLTLRADWAPRAAGQIWATDNDGLQVFFFGEDGQLNEIFQCNEHCVQRQIKKIPSNCLPVGGLAGVYGSRDPILVYRDQSGHLHLLDGTNGWKRRDLTKATKSPKAFGMPAVCQWSDGIHVVYRSHSGHLNQLFQRGSSWIRYPVSQRLNCPKAAGNPVGIARNQPTFYYSGKDQHLHELVFNGRKWAHTRLTGAARKPATLGDPVVIGGDPIRLIYRAKNESLYELQQYGSKWRSRCVIE